jgi:succinyl-CoA synthetase beta subunit
MSAIVDFCYYQSVYMGTEADPASFPALNAHASRVVASMTRWQVTPENLEQFPSLVQTLYKLAICSQIDFLAINGVESINSGDDVGFSVGKVRVDGKARSSAGGAMSASISPATISYLEQSGLMNPGVPVVGCCVC